MYTCLIQSWNKYAAKYILAREMRTDAAVWRHCQVNTERDRAERNNIEVQLREKSREVMDAHTRFDIQTTEFRSRYARTAPLVVTAPRMDAHTRFDIQTTEFRSRYARTAPLVVTAPRMLTIGLFSDRPVGSPLTPVWSVL